MLGAFRGTFLRGRIAVSGITGPAPTYPIESVENALKLLLLFKARDAITVADAASELGVARSTAHRLLAMLHAYGFVSQAESRGAYTIGLAAIDIGARFLAGMDIRSIVRPFVERLSLEVNETANFGVRFDDRIVFIETFQSRESLRVSNQPGQQFSAHGSAIGRALLALLSQDDIQSLYPAEALLPSTPAGIALEPFPTRTALMVELAAVRERGYACNYDAPSPGVCAIAAAIRDHRGRTPGAIAVSAPTARVRRDDIETIAAIVMRTAREIAKQLP
jgi:IclR family acetate operon transcriptional repressor